jgi:TonB family protein
VTAVHAAPAVALSLTLSLTQTSFEPRPGFPVPEYPEAARRLLVAGDVSFRARVSSNGSVEDVLVLGVPEKGLGFEEAVREAVARWRFEPHHETRFYLGRHRFELRPDDEREIRALAEDLNDVRFHDASAVFLDGRVHRKTDGSWPSSIVLAKLSGEVRAIDFSAANAAVVALETDAVLRVLKNEGAWLALSWEERAERIDPPDKIRDVVPVFPRDARQAKLDDVVVLQALIDHEGSVTPLDVVSSHSELETPAVTAVSDWLFRPARRNGMAIPFVMTLTVGFRGEPPR